MRVEYSKRAISDLRQIAIYYARSGSSVVAESIAARVKEVVETLSESYIFGTPPGGHTIEGLVKEI